jgi:hypothetical protein
MSFWENTTFATERDILILMEIKKRKIIQFTNIIFSANQTELWHRKLFEWLFVPGFQMFGEVKVESIKT